MFIKGVDYHPSFQQIAFLHQETGECGEQRFEGRRWKKRLWNKEGRAQLENLPLAPWASRRRRDSSYTPVRRN
jgi:hypothetical protein